MTHRARPVGTGVLALILLSSGTPFLVAQPQPVTREAFESSTPEGYSAVEAAAGIWVWGVPDKHTNDSHEGAVAYMLLGALKGCEFANAEADRGSKVYVRKSGLGTLTGYESQEICRTTSRAWSSSFGGSRITHILFFDQSSPSNTSEASYDEATGEYLIDTSTYFSPLRFPEGTSVTRFVEENSFAGTNVGEPVRAVGSGSLTYMMSGPDADSFSLVAGTGQIRTKDGVAYDYETTDRYSVTVSAQDSSGNTDSIAVAIEIEDLKPSCTAPPDFRSIAGDGSVNLSWTPAEDIEGNARVQGYQVQMRQESNGIWGATRTLLGRGVTGIAYGDLVNTFPYQFRIRPLQAEGDCEWHESEIVTPELSRLAPLGALENFRAVGRRAVGTPDRNYRFLSPERCRHTAGGATLDATCRYVSTGASSATISLEFDDPSVVECKLSLAYESPTSGSFDDECSGPAVRVDFDTSFRLPPLPEEEQQNAARVPRSQGEFDALAWGRNDLVPGLGFGCLPEFPLCTLELGSAYRIERSSDTRSITHIAGSYTYESTGPAQGTLAFEGSDGKSFTFTLDVQQSGTIHLTVTDPDGNSPGWPGMPDGLVEGSSSPVLLPIPPSWLAAIEVETDVAPENWGGLEARIPTPGSPEFPDTAHRNVLQRLLLGDIWDRASVVPDEESSGAIVHQSTYRKIGRNRATVTITWERAGVDGDDELTPLQRTLAGSTWTYDIGFLTEDSGTIGLTVERNGDGPIVDHRFLDLKSGGRTDSFPNELTLPDEAPQASGQDITGVQLAPVSSTASIGVNDIQTFLVNGTGTPPYSYALGDWLEPKDGGDQRMMVVASSQAVSVGPAFLTRSSTLRGPARPDALGGLADLLSYQSPALPPPARQQSMNPALTEIAVVCMQQERDVPLRGARYFSQPKAAVGEVQLCQKNCVTEGGDPIQRCVWECETDRAADAYTRTIVWTVRPGQVTLGPFSSGECILHGAITSSKWQRRDNEDSPWTDIWGTERTGEICSYAPTASGQYRAVGIITIDGHTDMYASDNILTVRGEQIDPPPP